MAKMHQLSSVKSCLLNGDPKFIQKMNRTWTSNVETTIYCMINIQGIPMGTRENTLSIKYEVKSKEERYVVLDGWYYKNSNHNFIEETVFSFDEGGFLTGVLNRKYESEKESQIPYVDPTRLHPSVLLKFEQASKQLGITFDPQE